MAHKDIQKDLWIRRKEKNLWLSLNLSEFTTKLESSLLYTLSSFLSSCGIRREEL